MIPDSPLSLALPKGRLFDQTLEYFAARGLSIPLPERELVVTDNKGMVKVFIVKNSDLPVYVTHGIAGLGICGSDVLRESRAVFFELLEFPFGSTRMCLAALEEDHNAAGHGAGHKAGHAAGIKRLKVATKFPVFTRDFFNSRGIPVEIIKLHGSVELAPVLGLAPYIVDLVETGSTLKANGLKIIEELENTKVKLIANPAYYKIHYQKVNAFVNFLKGQA
ncbi:MAG: ATP phosphoribosyltransferase [Spirochaetales bacterium]|jgi:ATP phosphoribosyltransferase|nr:ATP phosphoribosyltransferase [Spirochaetales bacterium]